MTGGGDHSRDPCPYNIVNDVGIGFTMGAVGGSVWHGFKGYRNAPRGERLFGSLSAIKARAPITGGNFAVWSGLFNAIDCGLVGLRGKEDTWNPIMAGASTGAILAARSGTKAIAVSAVFGGVILAVMEGVGALIGRMTADNYQPVAPALPEVPASAQQQLPNNSSNSLESSSSSSDTGLSVGEDRSQSGFSLFKGRFGSSRAPASP